MDAAVHQVDDVRCARGELSFDAYVGDRREKVWLRTGSELVPSADATLAATLMPAMRAGGVLRLPEPISGRILRTQREYQAIQQAWSLTWPFGDPPLREVEVRAPAREPEAPRLNHRAAAFISGGVDSWSTVVSNPDLTDLIFVRGFDLMLGAEHQAELIDEAEGRLRGAAEELGLGFHVVETNLRSLTDPLAPWEVYYATALVAVALFLEPLFGRVLIAGENDYEIQPMMGANHFVDQLWSTERMEIVDDGGRFSRVEKTRRIATHPTVQRTLRVCWENLDGAYNCGRCQKCLMTMITLEAYGLREQVRTFPSQLDLSPLEGFRLQRPASVTIWEDILDAVRENGRRDLEGPVAKLVEDGKYLFGLPPRHRTRALPGPAPLADSGGPAAADGIDAAPPADPDEAIRLAEERRARAEAMAAELMGSTSWRLTAPLRRATALARRLRRGRAPARRRTRM